jgi:streptogramin lyase
VRARIALGLAGVLAAAACSGGGSSSPQAPRATKTAPATLSIVIPVAKPSQDARRARFVSAGTQSGGIAIGQFTTQISQSFALSATAPNCSTSGTVRTCRVAVNLPLGNDTITLFTFDGPLVNGQTSGHRLGVATATQTIAEGQANTVAMSLLGVPALATIVPQPPAITATGKPVTVALAVTVFDASGNEITGTDPYAQPVVVTAQSTPLGANLAFTVNGAGGNTLTKPGDTVTMTYPGSGGTGSAYQLVATTTTNFSSATIGTAPFTIDPGFSLVQQLAGGLANADVVQRYDTRDIWFTEPASHKIALLSPSGTVTEYAVPSGKEPRHIAFTGNTGIGGFGLPIVITEYPDAIGIVRSNGTITETTTPTANPGIGGIWYDVTQFRLWFAESAGNIGTADVSGHITEYPVGIAGSSPAAVAQNCNSGNMWFTDPGKNAIGSMSKSDHSVIEYPVPTANAGPSAIVCGNTNDTWFAESNAAKLGHVDNFTGTIVEYPAPDVIVSLVPGLADGSNAAVWALTRGGTVLRYDSTGAYRSHPVTLAGNGTPIVITQGYYGDLLILRNGAPASDLDLMLY